MIYMFHSLQVNKNMKHNSGPWNASRGVSMIQTIQLFPMIQSQNSMLNRYLDWHLESHMKCLLWTALMIDNFYYWDKHHLCITTVKPLAANDSSTVQWVHHLDASWIKPSFPEAQEQEAKTVIPLAKLYHGNHKLQNHHCYHQLRWLGVPNKQDSMSWKPQLLSHLDPVQQVSSKEALIKNGVLLWKRVDILPQLDKSGHLMPGLLPLR